jgi:hypothetical protein
MKKEKRGMKRVFFAVIAAFLLVGAPAFAQTIGIAPIEVENGTKIPISKTKAHAALVRGVETSGLQVVPAALAANGLLADYVVVTRVEGGEKKGLKLTLSLYDRASKSLNQETAVCSEPDCSFGDSLRLLAKELVRRGLAEIAAQKAVEDKGGVVEKPSIEERPLVVAEVKSTTMPPAASAPSIALPLPVREQTESKTADWVWGAGIGGAAFVVGGVGLVLLDGYGGKCHARATMDGQACLNEADTKVWGLASMITGGVGLAAAGIGYMASRGDARISLLPAWNGLQVAGTF